MWLLLALVIFHWMQWDFLKYGWLKGWGVREGVANVMGMCVLTYISFQLSPPSALLLWFQMEFHFPFLFHVRFIVMITNETKRNEFSLWPTKRELCDYLLRKLMQCEAASAPEIFSDWPAFCSMFNFFLANDFSLSWCEYRFLKWSCRLIAFSKIRYKNTIHWKKLFINKLI